MDIKEVIPRIIDILNEYPNVQLINCEITRMDALIEIQIKRPPKENEETPHESSY